MGLLTCAFCLQVIGPIVAAEIFDLKTERKTSMIGVHILTFAMTILICIPAIIVGDLFELPQNQLDNLLKCRDSVDRKNIINDKT